MINGMILREQSNILEEGGIDLSTQLFMENMNLHIQLFNQEIMNESSYIMEADNGGNFIQKAISIIKESAKKFGNWILQKVKELKEKLFKLFRKNKSNTNTSSSNTTNSTTTSDTSKESNTNNPEQSNNKDDTTIEIWDCNFKWSFSDLFDMINGKEDLNNINIENYKKTINRIVKKATGMDDISNLTPDVFIEKSNKNRSELEGVMKNLEKMINDATNIAQQYKDISNKCISELEKMYKDMSKSRTDKNDRSYSGDTTTISGVNRSNMHNYRKLVSDYLNLYRLETNNGIKIISTQIAAINQCISHNATL